MATNNIYRESDHAAQKKLLAHHTKNEIEKLSCVNIISCDLTENKVWTECISATKYEL